MDDGSVLPTMTFLFSVIRSALLTECQSTEWVFIFKAVSVLDIMSITLFEYFLRFLEQLSVDDGIMNTLG